MKVGEDDENSTFPKNIVPLRTILRNFVHLVENCENRRNGEADLYEQEFQVSITNGTTTITFSVEDWILTMQSDETKFCLCDK